MSELSKQKKNPHRFMGVSRELINWYPIINPDQCNNCADCVEFCAHDVFEVEEGKVRVKNPKNCVVFCQACNKMCPIDGAMIFQSKKEVLAQIKQIKKQKRKKKERDHK
jgi:NAD-dependent dihydropyrimidine dehydrogenase PreA subunit